MPETTQSMTNPAPRCQRKIESRQCSDKCQISSAEGPGLILVLVLNFIHKLILKCFLSTHMAAVALTGVVNGSGKYCSSQLDTVPGTHSLDQSCDAIDVAILDDEDVDFAEDAVKDVNEDGADKCAAWYLH
uniref:HDC13300 n=1 Tax=Drosophila melanogaster TaxID=7227 RepID=Q6IK63_DROME|nr:TPA_inf: HDC13300 [Drosophila melanogaster]